MPPRFIQSVTLLACTLFSTMALADPPALVGRVSLVQGQVSIRSDVADGAGAAQLNWPVTSHNQITTGAGARTEIRIGSSSVRLDANASLDVSALDDDSVHLYLNYGSASVRIVNPELLPGFVLSTPNGRIRLQQPGRLRIDAGRASTVLTVFDGVALVEDRGTQLIVRAGKRAEIGDDDVRTGAALRDSFDDWAQQRDQRDQLDARSPSARYVTREMTGVEALDQNGVWRDDAEYGPLWLPSGVGPGWAPYRDGNWSWIAPWGWTWVDNAPWGYAPFHYGRWVQLEQRWAWAPGRQVGRPVWAPALVGWVGGTGAHFNFDGRASQRALPAQGWYPLTPRDAFVPGYRLSQDHLQRINRDVRPDWRGDAGRRDGRGEPARDGLSVVPHPQFGQRGAIDVRSAPPAASFAPIAPFVPFAPQNTGRDAARERDGRFERFERSDAMQRNRQPRPELGVVPAPAPRPPLTNPAPLVRHDGRPPFDERALHQPPATVAAPPAMFAPMTPQVIAPPPAAQPPRQFAPAPVIHHQPAPAPAFAPVPAQPQQPAPVMMRPAPPAAPAPTPAPMMVRQPPPASQQGAPAERKTHPGVERKRGMDAER